MYTTMRFMFLTAIRDRLFPAIIVLILAMIGITMALSETAMLEEHFMHLAMSAGIARIILNIGIALFVCFHIRSMYDTREIDVMLSRPVSRPALVAGFWAGFALVALAMVAALTVCLAVISPHSIFSLIVWSGTLLLESWIVISIGLFASLTNKSAVTSVMVCFTLYVLGRLMAFFVATANARMSFEEPWLNNTMKYIIEFVSILMPRLDMFAHTEWLIYGMPSLATLAFPVIQCIIFVPFVLSLAVIDFNRKQF